MLRLLSHFGKPFLRLNNWWFGTNNNVGSMFNFFVLNIKRKPLLPKNTFRQYRLVWMTDAIKSNQIFFLLFGKDTGCAKFSGKGGMQKTKKVCSPLLLARSLIPSAIIGLWNSPGSEVRLECLSLTQSLSQERQFYIHTWDLKAFETCADIFLV